MTLKEKQTLINLLMKYCSELVDKYEYIEKANLAYYEYVGIKSKYNHARIIANELSKSIGKNDIKW